MSTTKTMTITIYWLSEQHFLLSLLMTTASSNLSTSFSVSHAFLLRSHRTTKPWKLLQRLLKLQILGKKTPQVRLIIIRERPKNTPHFKKS